MIEQLSLVNPVDAHKNQIRLHPQILDILYEHHHYVRNVFQQIAGLFEISYFGLSIIDPSHEMVVFSSTPNIEYNLIQQNLWRHDFCFAPSGLCNDHLYCWDEPPQKNSIEEKIAKIKLQNNKFTLGMTIPRQIDNFAFLYSYATQSNKKDLKEYYLSNIFGLIDIGDYFWKSIAKVYSEYNEKYVLPKFNHFTSKTPRLKLVVNKG